MSSMRDAFEKAHALKSGAAPETDQKERDAVDLAIHILNGPSMGLHVFVFETTLRSPDGESPFSTRIEVDGKLGPKIRNDRFLRSFLAHRLTRDLGRFTDTAFKAKLDEALSRFRRHEIKRYLSEALSYRLVGAHQKPDLHR